MTKKKNIAKNKNNSYVRLIIVLVAIIIIISSLMCIVYYDYLVLDYKEIYAEVEVATNIGMSADTDALWFGKIMPNGKSTKKLYVSYPETVKVNIKVDGNISDFIIINKNNFILQENTTELLEFKAIAPEDAEYGKYNGTVQFYFLRPSLFG
jgi:hypothetical protein